MCNESLEMDSLATDYPQITHYLQPINVDVQRNREDG